jgi:hypothetical protein
MKEAFEYFHLRDPVEQFVGADRVHGRTEPPRLGSVPQPLPLLRHEHVRVVIPRGRTIDAAQLVHRVERIAGRLGDGPAHETGRQLLQVRVRDGVRRSGQRGITERRGTERIELCREMPVPADRLRQVERRHCLVQEVWRDLRGRYAWCAGIAGRPRLEGLACFRIYRIGIAPIAFVQFEHIPGVHTRELVQFHNLSMVLQCHRRRRDARSLKSRRKGPPPPPSAFESIDPVRAK